MALTYAYHNALLASTLWTEALTDVVRVGTLSLTELAEHLQVGESTITLDDPDASLGHDGDHIAGLRRFMVEDDDEDAGNERVHTGIISTRVYRRGDSDRGSLITAAARQIAVQIKDLNAIPSLRIIPADDATADRPAETVNARLDWLLGSDYLLNRVSDRGLVESCTKIMSPTNYQEQNAANVISDCEIYAGFGWNAWIYYEDSDTDYGLGFINANTSTAYSSTLRISNLMSDVDTGTVSTFTTGTTFYPASDAELTRDPGGVASVVHVPWNDGVAIRRRAATAAIFGATDVSAPNTNIRTPEKARDVADDFLFQHSTEADNISVKIEVPTSKVNHIRAGQRLEVKFTHLPGYESFTWCRVIRRTVIQEQATDRYILDLDLTPQEAAMPVAPCSASATPDGTYYPLGGNNTTSFSNPSDGVVHYWRAGIEYPWIDDFTEGIWHFPLYGAGGIGTIDYAGDHVNNRLIFTVVGNGTMTIQTEMFGGVPHALFVTIEAVDVATLTSGDSVEIVIDDRVDGNCVTLVEVRDDGSVSNSKWGWSEMVWVGA